MGPNKKGEARPGLGKRAAQPIFGFVKGKRKKGGADFSKKGLYPFGIRQRGTSRALQRKPLRVCQRDIHVNFVEIASTFERRKCHKIEVHCLNLAY